jgi:general secretion pathway protein D
MMLAMGIMMLYGANPASMMGMMGMMGMGGMGGMGMGGMMGGGMMGGGMMGGMNPYGGGMMGGMNPYGGGMMGGGMSTYGSGYGAPLPTMGAASPFAVPAVGATTTTGGTPGAPGTPDQTGQYLGSSQVPGGINPRAPRIVPNPFNNTLMIQATAQDYEQIVKLLRDMDLPPRQVLIDARIYEVDLGNNLSTSLAATLQDKGTSTDPAAHHFIGSLAGAATNLTDGFLVGRTKELLTAVQALEGATKAKIISAPSVIATDSIPASINVGVEVPTLTAQAVTGAQQGGNSLFANTVSDRNTGVTLNITAQINPSGIVTLLINQEVSAPQAPAAGGIQSPSFSKRSVQTQVTVQDGDTIAIGGIITESNTFTTSGIPYLNHLPIIGAAFGSRAYAKSRTELIIFMTPRVIYDTNQIQEASDQLKDNVKRLKRMIRDQ